MGAYKKPQQRKKKAKGLEEREIRSSLLILKNKSYKKRTQNEIKAASIYSRSLSYVKGFREGARFVSL